MDLTELVVLKWAALRYIEMLVDLVLQLVTHLFGVTQQHLCVLFVKHCGLSAPAYPAPMVRFITITALLFHTCARYSACQYVHVKLYGFACAQLRCSIYTPAKSTYNSKLAYQ